VGADAGVIEPNPNEVAAAQPPAPLIGSDDVKLPSWAKGFESTAKAGLLQVAKRVPRIVAEVTRSAWRVSPRLTVLSGILHLLSGAVTAFGLLATADVFAQLLQQGPTPARVTAALPALAVVAGAHVARSLLSAGVSVAQGALAPKLEQHAAEQLHAAVAAVDLVAFDDPDFAHLVEQASGSGLSRVEYSVHETGRLLSECVETAAALLAATLLHPLLLPVVVLGALPRAWSSVRSARLMFEHYIQANSRQRRKGITSYLITSRYNAAEVRAFGVQDILMREHVRISRELTDERVRLGRRRTAIWVLGEGWSGLGNALAYLVLGALLYTGELALALAGAAVLAMRAAAQSVSSTISEANDLYESDFFLDLVRSCLTDAQKRRRAAGTEQLDADPDLIELRDATFRYPGAEHAAVSGIDLTLRRGEVIALVGENGSGKSTLAKLITGLYLPSHGSVTWNGVPTSALSARDLQQRVAVVMQDSVRWPMTAENNVRIGKLERSDLDRAWLASAAEHSGADTVVAELDRGWETLLSRSFQQGRDLSGGQWQRLAVARGLYRNAAVVVADEPTAALDARAENTVFGVLRGLDGTKHASRDRITVLVTHRLANIRHADQILVLAKGRLIERGRHAELMALGGTYKELFTLQAHAYGREAINGDAAGIVP